MNIWLLVFTSIYKYYRDKSSTQSSASFAAATLILSIILILVLDIFIMFHLLGFNSKILAEKSIFNRRFIWALIGIPLIYGLTLILPKSEIVEKIELTPKQMRIGLFITFGFLVLLFMSLFF